MRRVVLSGRLAAVAALVGRAEGVVDVGTDHGLLPVFLAQSGLAGRIVATDCRRGPLERAVAAAEECGVSGRIEFVLTDGLAGVDMRGIDTVVVAGLGGETIASILKKAPWALEGGARFVLQPQTKVFELERFLVESGLSVRDAAIALDGGRLYPVMLAGVKSGDVPGRLLDVLAARRDERLPDYLEWLIRGKAAALDGMRRSSAVNEERIRRAERELEGLLRLKEEVSG